MASYTAANAARATIKAEKMARYIAAGGPAMTAGQAAAAIGVSISAIRNYRRELVAAGIIGQRPRGPVPAELADPPPAPVSHPGGYPAAGYRWRDPARISPRRLAELEENDRYEAELEAAARREPAA